MRAVVTRVHHASVTIDGEVRGRIGQGFLVLLGVYANSKIYKKKKIGNAT